MKTEITVTPNRERGYDATVREKLPKYLHDECGAFATLHVVNGRNEAEARALAESWLVAQPKPAKAKRAARFDEGACEAQEAARNEREYA